MQPEMTVLVMLAAGTLSSCSGHDSHQALAFAAPKLPSFQCPDASAVARPSVLQGSFRVPGKRLLLRAKEGSASEKDDDIFGNDFPSYNYNAADGTDGAPKLPKFAKKNTQGAGGGFQGFGGVGSRRTLPSLAPEDMTEELKERVFYVMLDAFDNYPPQAVGRMLDLLWEAGPDAGPTQTSLRQLVVLTDEVERIAEESRVRSATPGAQFGDLLEALRVARSRVRMNAKDADMYDPQSVMGFLKKLGDDSESSGGMWSAWGFGAGGTKGGDDDQRK